jgi:hypothetical protein
MARTKERRCEWCGVSHPLTKKYWYLYEYATICHAHEKERQAAKHAAKRDSK